MVISAYTDGSVSNGTTYYYVVTALDSSGNESANSTEASATPQPAPAEQILEENTSGGDKMEVKEG